MAARMFLGPGWEACKERGQRAWGGDTSQNQSCPQTQPEERASWAAKFSTGTAPQSLKLTASRDHHTPVTWGRTEGLVLLPVSLIGLSTVLWVIGSFLLNFPSLGPAQSPLMTPTSGGCHRGCCMDMIDSPTVHSSPSS